MKKIDVMIPTRNRPKKLLRTLESIPREAAGVPVRRIVCFDRDPINAGRFRGAGFIDEILELPRPGAGSIAARNFMTARAEDALIYATDDIEFDPGAIEAAAQALARFEEDDGVIGFVIRNDPRHCPSGVALVGRPFLERYAGRQLFYPGYFHFGAQEVGQAARHWGLFYQERDARLFHHHPGHYPKESDKTHIDARIHKARDQTLWRIRQRKHLIWGVNG